MGTPKAVLEAEAEADRLVEKLSGSKPTVDDEPKPDDQAGEADEADEEPLAEELEEESDEEPEEDSAEGEAEPAAAGDSQIREQLAELQAKYDKLLAAHETLKGKTYAEVPRVLSENKQLRDRIAELEARTASGQPATGGERTGVPASGSASKILASLKERVNEDIADEIASLVSAVAEEAVTARIKGVEGSVETLKKSALETQQERYVKTLTQLVPDWRDIAADPEYAAMLTQRDEYSGATLYDLASGALDRLDAEHMAVFFNRFKKEKGMPIVGSASARGERKKPVGKEALLSPRGSARGSSEGRTQGVKPDYITIKQLEEFNRNRKKMTPEQEAKMEARVDRAIQNGWVIPG